MDDFLKPFFPDVYAKKTAANRQGGGEESAYCKFDSQVLTAFTSSLYLAGLFASFAAAHYTKRKGRVFSIRVGGLTFLMGSILNAAAVNVTMLILGRVLLGVGVGFGNQVPFTLFFLVIPSIIIVDFTDIFYIIIYVLHCLHITLTVYRWMKISCTCAFIV